MPENYPEFWGSDELELWDSVDANRNGDMGGMLDDPVAQAYFSAGWLEDEYSPEERQAIRDQFYDYVIEEGYFYDREDFDWDAWREYMDYGTD